MLVKLTKEFPTADWLITTMHSYVQWATSKQIADFVNLDDGFKNRIGFVLGYAGRPCVELSYKGRKVRAWYVGHGDISTYTLDMVRNHLIEADAWLVEINSKRTLLANTTAAAL